MTSHYFRTARANHRSICMCDKHVKYSHPLAVNRRLISWGTTFGCRQMCWLVVLYCSCRRRWATPEYARWTARLHRSVPTRSLSERIWSNQESKTEDVPSDAIILYCTLKIKCNVFSFVEVNFSTSVFNTNKSIWVFRKITKITNLLKKRFKVRHRRFVYILQVMTSYR